MKTGKHKIKTIRILRTLSQIVLFILLPALYISTLSGIKQIYLSILHQSFSFGTLMPQITEAIAIVPITVLIGRFFCGWMCAFGALEDFLSFVSLKIFKRRFRISEKADSMLKYAKYLLLVLLIALVWNLGVTVFNTSNPWDAFGMLLPTGGKMPDIAYVITNLAPAFIILLLIVGASLFVDRFFCRYLCPLGAIFSLISKIRITGILKPRTKCGACRVCTNSCPMGISLYQKDSVKSGECINCFECVSACPRKNVSLSVSESDIRPVLAGTMAVAVMTGTYYAGSFAANQFGFGTSVSQSTTSTASEQIYNDGTYQGTGTGFRGAQTTVSVTIKNDRITAIKVKSYGDDQQFFSRASSSVIKSIINTQSVSVNAVSGATYSSNGIMSAVEDALSNARITDNASNSTSESTGSESAESTASSSAPTQSSSQSSSAAASSSVQSSASSATAKNAKYKDGTYQGSGTGYRNGTTIVSVTVKNGAISDISILSSGDDKPFLERAGSTVIQSIISSQSTSVNAVSGATFSSRGIMKAVADAMAKAV